MLVGTAEHIVRTKRDISVAFDIDAAGKFIAGIGKRNAARPGERDVACRLLVICQFGIEGGTRLPRQIKQQTFVVI